MANGDLAESQGLPVVSPADRVGLGYDDINALADAVARIMLGQLGIDASAIQKGVLPLERGGIGGEPAFVCQAIHACEVLTGVIQVWWDGQPNMGGRVVHRINGVLDVVTANYSEDHLPLKARVDDLERRLMAAGIAA